MTWVAVGSAAVSVVGGAIARNQQNKAAKGAANAISQAQQQQYDQTREDLAPYRDLGASAIPLLGKLNSGDYSGFLNSPDYLAALNLGQDQIDRSAAARGGLFGGGHTRDSIKYGSGLAAQYLNQYRGSLMDQAQMGQNSAVQLGQFGANAANNIGNAQSGYLQQRGQNNSDFATGALGGLSNMWGSYMAGRPATSRTSSYGQGAYVGPGGSPLLGQAQPKIGNNYGNFGTWGWS